MLEKNRALSFSQGQGLAPSVKDQVMVLRAVGHLVGREEIEEMEEGSTEIGR